MKSFDVFYNFKKSVIEKKKLTEIELPDKPRIIASIEKPDKKNIEKKIKSQDSQFDA